ncbi:MAG: hypothetical protein PWP04_341 [Candidatus Atribacteria bacterium]|nr:hypothetical protein [Candidatus Atribacteria bacterium]
MLSMTGFGYAEGEGNLAFYRVSVRSLNHRFFSLNLHLPKELYLWEEQILSLFRERLSRGKVDLRVDFEPKGSIFTVEPDPDLARSYLDALRRICSELGLPFVPRIEILLQTGEGIIRVKEESQKWVEEWYNFQPILENCLTKLVEFREREGAKLQQDLDNYLKNLKKILGEIKNEEGAVSQYYRDKLNRKLQEVAPQSPVNEALLAQELIFYLDRSDINEEVIRLKTHLERIGQLLNKKGAIGREMEFILQEINREINTVGSKSGSAKISSLVVDMKTIVEKMREQIQNIE